jgi:hypothetical protein
MRICGGIGAKIKQLDKLQRKKKRRVGVSTWLGPVRNIPQDNGYNFAAFPELRRKKFYDRCE